MENKEPKAEDFIRLSERMSRLPQYIFSKINHLKDRKRREGIDVIDMAMGNPTDPTPEPIVEKLCEVVRDPRNHRYSTAAGIYNLRREMAKYYQAEYGVQLDPEKEVICTIGSKEGFSHLCLAVIGSGDTAFVPAPSYPIHSYGVVLAGGSYLSIPVYDDEEFLRRVDDTCKTYFPKPKVLFLNYPHNPTAHTVEPEFFREVVVLANRHQLIVVHDFAYGGIAFDGYRPPSFLETPGAMDIGVEFTTMSKSFNMAGWRIGFCCGNARIIDGLARVKGYYDYGIFQAIQIASIIGLRECKDFPREQSGRYQERRDALMSGLERAGWTDIDKPRGGMFLWAKMPPEFQAMGSMEFALRLMEDAEVAVAPGAAFGPEGEGFVRIALIENRQRIQQAARQIRRALHQLRSKEARPPAEKAG
ncbi:MAG: aminotransferase class I/II-fold pyridoxal phosphate-dependent enzyme [Planctomycetes bacterium]|nr:aminotransferase class I/II-fold pyridoxal phosphate-dependent enzyme [Planctomycetota bacterium]